MDRRIIATERCQPTAPCGERAGRTCWPDVAIFEPSAHNAEHSTVPFGPIPPHDGSARRWDTCRNPQKQGHVLLVLPRRGHNAGWRTLFRQGHLRPQHLASRLAAVGAPKHDIVQYSTRNDSVHYAPRRQFVYAIVGRAIIKARAQAHGPSQPNLHLPRSAGAAMRQDFTRRDIDPGKWALTCEISDALRSNCRARQSRHSSLERADSDQRFSSMFGIDDRNRVRTRFGRARVHTIRLTAGQRVCRATSRASHRLFVHD